MKDFVLKSLVAQDQPWWPKNSSDWKITADHPWCDADAYNPDYWQDRVLSLCSYDITQSNFGLSYLDLMDLDIPTFEAIEESVHKIAEKQQAALPPELKEKMNQQSNGSNMFKAPKL